MKRIILTFLLSVLFVFYVSADDRPVRYSDLPEAARSFLESAFPGVKVAHAFVDDDFVRPDYTVILKGGFEVEFDHAGRLEKIDADDTFIPSGIIPLQIRDYVRLHYPGAGFIKYEVDRRSYEVKLSNGMELEFNADFNLMEIDD